MKILLVDDHALFREGMHFVLNRLGEEIEILDAGSFSEAVSLAGSNPDLDLVLLDLDFPGSDGASSVKLFASVYPDFPVVVISASKQRDEIEQVMNNGAMGFISKLSSGEEMVNALRLVLDGGVYLPPQLLDIVLDQVKEDKRQWGTNEYGLTRRQMEVLKYLAGGLTNKEICLAIGMADGTLRNHISAIFHALKVNKRLDAILKAQRIGLLEKNISD